jgi:hypothetical protein
VKAYLITTGTLFGLIAVAHLLRSIGEWQAVKSDAGHFTVIVGFGALAAALSIWAWCLLRSRPRVVLKDDGRP